MASYMRMNVVRMGIKSQDVGFSVCVHIDSVCVCECDDVTHSWSDEMYTNTNTNTNTHMNKLTCFHTQDKGHTQDTHDTCL